MDTVDKIQLLGEAAQFDLACGGCGSAPRQRASLERWIYPAALPDGKEVRLLKILQTSACIKDCLYCVTRCSRNQRRVTFQPEELARSFHIMHQQRLVNGLFLSSGVADSAKSMEKMLTTVEILRERYRFRGYVHLKIMPEAPYDTVAAAVQLADRVSVNLEAPNAQRLRRIAEEKDFDGLLLRMRWIHELTRKMQKTHVGQTTQFVVGASEEPDREILTTVHKLYTELNLGRAYFSAFQPVRDTPLEDHVPTPLLREHRLYQADWLLRKYGFQFEELIFDHQGNLPLKADPKLVWALNHPERFPVEINTASKEELVRVPGIGPQSALRVIRARRRSRFHHLEELKTLGAIIHRAAPFVLINGRQPKTGEPKQLELWDKISD